jgi:hypothetical protein
VEVGDELIGQSKSVARGDHKGGTGLPFLQATVV